MLEKEQVLREALKVKDQVHEQEAIISKMDKEFQVQKAKFDAYKKEYDKEKKKCRHEKATAD